MQTALSSTHTHRGNAKDDTFNSFMERLQKRFRERVAEGTPLFTTETPLLWSLYLAGFPSDTRQSHNCNACHHFIRRYGGLVTIDENGITHPAFWDDLDAPPEYVRPIRKVIDAVVRAKVTGVFLSSDDVYGHTGVGTDWHHYAIAPRNSAIYRSLVKNAGQAMAEKREDFTTVRRALAEFKQKTVEQAVALLETEALYRSEKVMGPAKWFRDLYVATANTPLPRYVNILWRAVATAPAGFCHPRSSMIGTLLEDIEAGMSFDLVAKRFKAKMDPLAYQRPQAPPRAGNIAQAEKIVEQLGIAGALDRWFARIDEIQTVWKPAPPPAPASGIFGHLKSATSETGRASSMQVPGGRITWDKFQRTVLPIATKLEAVAPYTSHYTAILTATEEDAPPILQWDTPEQRNPFSWYLYQGGSHASRWGLRANEWTEVTAVALQPSMWFGDKYPHQGKGVVFMLKDARDLYGERAGLCLFPEILKSELHCVRSTIEAHSRSKTLSGARIENGAAGLMFNGKGLAETVRVRVTVATGSTVEYTIDRWD